MINPSSALKPAAPAAGMGAFERYLTLWVGLGMAAGVVLGLLAAGAAMVILGLWLRNALKQQA